MGLFHLKLIKKLRGFVSWIWRQEGTPAQRSIGMALGIFCGCFPLFGLQTLLGALLASVFKGNRLLAVLGTWISNPFTYIPLYWLNYKVGSLFIRPVRTVPSLTDLSRQELFLHGRLFSIRLFIGSTLVGLLLGTIFGIILYLILRKRYVFKSRV